MQIIAIKDEYEKISNGPTIKMQHVRFSTFYEISYLEDTF